jgi:two-component system cell cycle sensor histidine kinase/response regulator CckA
MAVESNDQASLGRSARAVLAVGVFLLVASQLAVRLTSDSATQRFFDNVHWTSSYACGAALAFLGARRAPPDSAALKRWVAGGLTAYLIGQLLWDVQVAIGWNPFPGPSDIFFVCLGLLTSVGLWSLLRMRASNEQRRTALLDAAGLSVGVLAVTLAAYLPRRGDLGILELVFLVGYPVLLCSAACLALVLVLSLRLSLDRGLLLFLLSLVANGALWLEWNSLTLDGALADGTLYNAGFSLSALVQGTGVYLLKLRSDASPRWERLCESLLRLLPFACVVLAAAGIVLAYTLPHVPEAMQWSTLLGAVLIVLIASSRQSLVLDDRERLIRAERALRASAAQYRVLMEQAADGIFIADPSGRYVDVNSRGAEMLGRTREEVVGLTIADIVVDDERERVPEAISELSGQRAVSSLWRMKRKNGETFFAEVSGKVLPDGRLQGMVRDVSERLELERQLRQSKKMEAIGVLSAGIAHDFNNILSAIRGNADLAASDVGPSHPACESIEQIRVSARRATDLVQQIVTFSRSEEPATARVDVSKVVHDVVSMLRSTLPARIELAYHENSDLLEVLGDASQIHQVMLNLCTNAWQAIEHGRGRIEIAIDRVTLTGSEGLDASIETLPGEYACIAIRDSGAGMTQETLERVFEPFFTTKEVGKGTGLGLSVVHGIVKNHRGGISVESRRGAGTTFRVYLRLTTAPAPTASSPFPPATWTDAKSRALHHACRVAYVDDEAALISLVTRQLERLGYQVHGFTSSEAAIAELIKRPAHFDVVVTDNNMPNVSGLELVQELTAARVTSTFVLTSGFIDAELTARATELGVTRVLQKPHDIEDLCKVLDSVMRKRAARSAS